jgi:hypothetical protein
MQGKLAATLGTKRNDGKIPIGWIFFAAGWTTIKSTKRRTE